MTDMDENDQVLAGEYALGLMDPDAARAFEVRLASDPVLRVEYASWCETLSAISPGEVRPAFYVKTEIDTRLFGAGRPFWQRFGKFVAGAGAAMAALAVFGFMTFATPQPDLLASLSADTTLSFQAAVVSNDRVLRVSALTSAPPSGRAHELWIIPAEGTPISLGILSEGRVTVPDGFALQGALLAITVEDSAGSLTGAPTTTPIAAAPLVLNPQV